MSRHQKVKIWEITLIVSRAKINVIEFFFNDAGSPEKASRVKKKIPKTLILSVCSLHNFSLSSQRSSNEPIHNIELGLLGALMLTLALFINQNHDQASMMSTFF